MIKNILTRGSALFLCCIIVLMSTFSVAAIDDTYTIDELGLSLKIPKEYTVITRTTPKNDDSFSKLGLDYDETINAFYVDHIYLQALSEDEKLRINLTQISDESSKTINNYSDLSAAQRQEALETFMVDESYVSGVELKHNDNIFFDFEFTIQGQNEIVFAYQCHTVVNGMNINLTMQKSGESFTADEVKIVTNIADSIDFDEIILKNGPSFDWWRFLLWIMILIAVAVIASYIYKRYNKKHKKSRERKSKQRMSAKLAAQDGADRDSDIVATQPKRESKAQLLSQLGFSDDDESQEEVPVSFDELLGYDMTDYHSRANMDMDSFDVKVKSNNSTISGVSYFEDDGVDINRKEDYFEDFFNEEVQPVTRKPIKKKGAVNNAKNASKRLGYFFVNLKRLIIPSKKSKRGSRKK